MSDFKIRFRNQAGRQIEVEANKMESSWNPNNVEESFDKSKVGDGKVDVMVSESKWFWRKNTHLGIDTSNLSQNDASALKEALENPRSADIRVFDAQSGRMLQGLRLLQTDAAGELSRTTPNLDQTGTRREVQLTPNGHIATPNGNEPQNLQEVGDGLFRAASMIDDVKGNLFDGIQAPLRLKEKMLDNLVESMGQVAPGQLPQGMDETQALQLRSTSATTLLELASSTANTSPEFQARALDQYMGAMKAETNSLLKDSMAFNLHRLKGSFPAELHTHIDQAMKLAPTEPPYEKWFANGNDTIKVDWSVGAGEGFLEDNIANLERQGFKVIDDSTRNPVLERTYEENGVETTIQVRFRTNHNNMFENVDDDDTNMVIYSGHSNWGRNVRDALKGMDGSGDGKVVMTNLCVGKGELQQMSDAFPDAHMITTHNSGYFRPGSDAEWHYAVNDIFEGIAKRRGYKEIANNVRESNPWTNNSWSTHRKAGVDNNFIFPTDLEVRRNALDQDHDGQADVFDRMVNFNTFDVKTDTAREFQPIEPSRASEDLVGTKIHFAAMNINRISIYSESLKPLNSTAEVVPGGYFDPNPGETSLFRFERSDDGRVNMEMNANYAHMSEEALRMAALYEYNHFKSTENNWNVAQGVDTTINGLILASQSLDTDKSYRDNDVWSEFLEAYNFPEIALRDVDQARHADHHWYSGSHNSITELKETLGRGILDQLDDDGVGQL